MIITIDGLGGTGKSSQSKLLASKLGFAYFNTGILYRYITYKLINDDVDFTNQADLNKYLSEFSFNIGKNGTLILDEGFNAKDLSSIELSVQSALIATIPEVRKKIVSVQREFGKFHDTIIEGRDTGSVIFPNADLKFLLTASPEVRAYRVFLEGRDTNSYKTILAGILERDEIEKQKNSYVEPQGAIKINTDNLTFEQVADILYNYSLQKQKEIKSMV